MRQVSGVWLLSIWLMACGGKQQQGVDDSTPGAGTGAGPSQGGDEPSAGGAPGAPPAQGAVSYHVGLVTPPIVGKMCPTTTFIGEIPDDDSKQREGPTELDYQHHIVDGEDGASMTCRVAGNGQFSFEAMLKQGGRSIKLTSGSLSTMQDGTVDVEVADASHISGSLASPAPCIARASKGALNNFQVKAGSIWGSFECATIEAPPSSSCSASGVFVLENCDQEY